MDTTNGHCTRAMDRVKVPHSRTDMSLWQGLVAFIKKKKKKKKVDVLVRFYSAIPKVF